MRAKVLADLDDELKTLGTQLDALKIQKRADQTPEAVPPELVDTRELETLRAELRTVENALSECEMAEKRRAVMEGAKQRMREELEELRKRRAELKAKMTEQEEQLKAVNAEKVLYEFWNEGFSDRGIKSFVLEGALPFLSQRATRYARRLIGPGASIELLATTTLKSDAVREKLSISAIIPGCTRSYASASKGQRKRLDIAILLAMRDFVSLRKDRPMKQLFADEFFDGMDATGAGNVVELLREISGGCPVFLIAHDPKLRSIGDRSFTVKHDGKIACLYANN